MILLVKVFVETKTLTNKIILGNALLSCIGCNTNPTHLEFLCINRLCISI